jgi:hypothetical protein
MNNAFVVEELGELLALQRVFREAKFCTEPDDMEVSDSPVVAKLFDQLIVMLIASDVERNGEDGRTRWEKWLAIDDSRDEWNAAIRRANADTRWTKFSADERSEYVGLLLSPFTVSPEIVERFVLAVNHARSV